MQSQENFTPLVTIRCITYNHEPYIRQCLEGFVMQKTNFRFEAIVHDDASTDGTAAIIREYAEKYPDIIKPIYEIENQYSKHDGSLDRIMDAHMRGKYIALCEGDDYWIDPLKLQKQVDFLEEHPDYGLIYTNYKIFNLKKNSFMQARWESKRLSGEVFDKLLCGNFIATATVLMKAEAWLQSNKALQLYAQKWLMGDYPLWLETARNWKIKYLGDMTTVYRKLPESASHSLDFKKILDFNNSVLAVQTYFAKLTKKEYLIPQIEAVWCSKLYLSCVENHFKDIADLRWKMQQYRYSSFKDRILQFASKHSFVELILWKLLNNVVTRSIYRYLFAK